MPNMRLLLRLLILPLLGAAPTMTALAQTLDVDAAPCAERVRVHAQDVPLAEVLRRLSQAMGFRLDLKISLDEKVTLDRRDSPERLLRDLMRSRNLVLQSDPNPKCKGRETLTTVWVLPAGEAAPVTAARAAPNTPIRTNLLRPEPPRGTHKGMSEEEWQQMKRDYLAGKIKADPETGKPVPVDTEPKAPAP